MAWKLFNGCQAFQMQLFDNLCSILQHFNWHSMLALFLCISWALRYAIYAMPCVRVSHKPMIFQNGRTDWACLGTETTIGLSISNFVPNCGFTKKLLQHVNCRKYVNLVWAMIITSFITMSIHLCVLHKGRKGARRNRLWQYTLVCSIITALESQIHTSV